MVYDVTRPETFERLGAWLDEARRFGAPPAMRVVVVGNKLDKGKRRVDMPGAKAWAAERKLPYVETSAETGVGVTELFTDLVEAASASVTAT